MTKLLILVAAATAVNEIARLRAGKEGGSLIIGAVIMTVILAALGNVWRWDVSYAIAVLFLVSSLVLNGQPLITATTQLLNGVRK